MKTIRPLRLQEMNLIRQMVKGTPEAQKIRALLAGSRVEEMNDGGMGSLRFIQAARPARRSARAIAEATAIDEDGVPVSIALNVDEDGDLYELDIWKVDFSPLKAFPKLVSESSRPR